mmetsp:Transcript_40010/g.77863  ORF Transcript_40010/g.77863 Transcript_40010/m.77863 type:complete len:208 (+) Transcript_40010:969-1592(+)
MARPTCRSRRNEACPQKPRPRKRRKRKRRRPRQQQPQQTSISTRAASMIPSALLQPLPEGLVPRPAAPPLWGLLEDPRLQQMLGSMPDLPGVTRSRTLVGTHLGPQTHPALIRSPPQRLRQDLTLDLVEASAMMTLSAMLLPKQHKHLRRARLRRRPRLRRSLPRGARPRQQTPKKATPSEMTTIRSPTPATLSAVRQWKRRPVRQR